jgi:hypothetical protein
MKKKLVLLFFIPFAVFAQDNTNDAKHQEIIMSVLQQIDEYGSVSSFGGDESRITYFQNLFVDLNTKIVNDIPAMGNYDQRISVAEYVKNMRNYYNRIGIDITINEISKIDFIDDNKGTLSVFLTKKVYGENLHPDHILEISKNNTQFLEYEDEFELEIKFEFVLTMLNDKINGISTLISDIRLPIPKGKLLVIAPHWRRFLAVGLTAQNEMKIKVDDKEIQVSGYFYSIPNITSATNIEISSADETFIGKEKISLNTYQKTDKIHLHKLTFTKPIGDFQGFVLFSPDFLKVNPNNFSADILDQSANSFGGSISYNIDDVFFNTKEKIKKKKMSIYLKAGLIKDNLDYTLNIPSYSETYNATDADGGNYERTVLLEDFNENQKIDMQTIFGELEFRFKPFKYKQYKGIGSISGGVGQLSVNSATYDNSANATYSGYYEDLFGITIAENGVYDFGNFNPSQSGDLEFNTNVQLIIIEASAMLQIKDRWMFSAGIMYTKYQSNIFNIGSDRISNDFNELNSINNLIDVDMSHISLKAGVSYKF